MSGPFLCALTPPHPCSYFVPMGIWTFRRLIDEGMTLTAYCHRSRCNHHAVLDVPALATKYGPDAPAMHDDLAYKLRCQKCGGRECGLRYAPDPNKWKGMSAGQGMLYMQVSRGR